MSIPLLASGLELIIDREGGIPHVTLEVCVISFLSFFAPGCTAHISHGRVGGGGGGLADSWALISSRLGGGSLS